MRKLEWDDMGVKVDGRQLHHLRFADDIVMITPSISQAERMLTEFDKTRGCIGLQLNLQKKMFMRNGCVSDAPFTLNGTNISECTSYVYLGRELNMMNDLTPELGRRRRAAWGAYKSIEDVVKKTRNTRLRAHLFNTTVLPALTYASETWAFRKQEENAVGVIERAIERVVLGVSRFTQVRNGIRSSLLRQRSKIRDAAAFAKEIKIRWAGHVMRFNDNRWTRAVSDWVPRDIKRTTGRQTADPMAKGGTTGLLWHAIGTNGRITGARSTSSKINGSQADQGDRDFKWSYLYETVITTLQSLYAKDSRVHFLPHEFWSNHQRQVVVTRRSFLPPRRRGFGMEAQQRMFTPFSFVRFLHGRPKTDSDSSESDEEAGPSHDLPASTADMRNLSIIRSIPFVVPFMQRVKIFQDLLAHDREANDIVDDFHSFAGMGSRRNGITIAVRRQHLYEDAFEALSLGNAPNLRLPVRVSMTNWVGLNEVGIDGGGIFREFLTELLRTGFDPDRGFFKYTHDRLLYPNPSSVQLYPDSYSQHFFFLGRVVAKLIYEKQMAEIRFAEFFVSQLLGRRQTDVDLHHMKSYDPAIYKHLKNLRCLTADELAALELDFSVIVDDIGDVQTVDLVPGGRNIRVTVDNRLEYIRSYVNLFLYKRIEPLVDAMRAGVSTVIDPGWLAMFSPSELQTLVSGADADLDVDDMMKHTAVHNIRDEADRDYMNLFWSVVSDMSPEDKRGLLKFITGCSRPPIEGFKMLYPAIGIQLVHDSDHLPTSATCMNLFKLPIYSSRSKLEDKLRYAINAGAGFELS
ncbi:hypothetical protein RB195_020519 [Necator americanus]|uniref:HECT-type E3 ubiquitin transferase n=1 Tax=Necator americanus TaxID=51031 RepID=A0ABR1CJ81_NECAM